MYVVYRQRPSAGGCVMYVVYKQRPSAGGCDVCGGNRGHQLGVV